MKAREITARFLDTNITLALKLEDVVLEGYKPAQLYVVSVSVEEPDAEFSSHAEYFREDEYIMAMCAFNARLCSDWPVGCSPFARPFDQFLEKIQ